MADAIIIDGLRPGIIYPRVPGHEVAGVVDALGTGVTEWRKGQRVGVGWHGGHDGTHYKKGAPCGVGLE